MVREETPKEALQKQKANLQQSQFCTDCSVRGEGQTVGEWRAYEDALS